MGFIEGQDLPVFSAPQQLAEVTSTSKKNILLSAISPNGRYLAIADSAELRTFQLERSSGRSRVLDGACRVGLVGNVVQLSKQDIFS